MQAQRPSDFGDLHHGHASCRAVCVPGQGQGLWVEQEPTVIRAGGAAAEGEPVRRESADGEAADIRARDRDRVDVALAEVGDGVEAFIVSEELRSDEESINVTGAWDHVIKDSGGNELHRIPTLPGE